MLRSNTNKAKANIRKYICDNFTPENYSPAFDHVSGDDFPAVAGAIYKTFRDEYRFTLEREKRTSESDLFHEWISGLPSIMDVPYMYKSSAMDTIADILEETEAERAYYYNKPGNRYTKTGAEKMISYLIYREIKNTISR